MKMLQAIAGTAALAALGAAAADGAIISQWTFEVSQPVTAGPFTAENGPVAGAASTTTGGTVSSPVGNGSAHSFSSNGWNTTEYFQFVTSSSSYEDLSVSFDAQGSNTGPRDFMLAYSTDGTNFTDFQAYVVTLASPSWNSTTVNTSTQYSFDLSAINTIENAASLTFRLIDTSTVSVNGGTVATGGTSRVDNFTVSALVPEPASLGLVGLGGLGLLRRRRAR